MSDNHNERHRSSLNIWLIVVVAMLPLYVLSTGPMMWLIRHGYIEPWILLLYTPLDLLGDYFPPARQFFNWYVGLWMTPTQVGVGS